MTSAVLVHVVRVTDRKFSAEVHNSSPKCVLSLRGAKLDSRGACFQRGVNLLQSQGHNFLTRVQNSSPRRGSKFLLVRGAQVFNRGAVFQQRHKQIFQGRKFGLALGGEICLYLGAQISSRCAKFFSEGGENLFLSQGRAQIHFGRRGTVLWQGCRIHLRGLSQIRFQQSQGDKI